MFCTPSRLGLLIWMSHALARWSIARVPPAARASSVDRRVGPNRTAARDARSIHFSHVVTRRTTAGSCGHGRRPGERRDLRTPSRCFDPRKRIPGDYVPLWSPGGRVLMLGNRSGLYSVRPDDASPPKAWSHGNTYEVPWSFTPDGKQLAYHRYGNATGFDLWTVPIRMTDDDMAPDTPERFLQTSAYETYPAFSPDGHWLAYGSGAYGKWEVYVQRVPKQRVDAGPSVARGRADSALAAERARAHVPNGRSASYDRDVPGTGRDIPRREASAMVVGPAG